MISFQTMLQRQWAAGKFVCVGLDPDLTKIPQFYRDAHPAFSAGLSGDCHAVRSFCMEIIDATKDAVCAYKPNAAFFELLGNQGHEVLAQVIAHIKKVAAEVPVIYDAKRGDIGNTNEGYARDAFDILKADAITIHPYMGAEANLPFLNYADKGIFILCRTSNSGAGEFQNLLVAACTDPHIHTRLYKIVAENVAADWNKNKNCGLVVGATAPEELAQVRRLVSDMPILIPGVGAQGGDLQKAVLAGKNSQNTGFIINVSRSVLYASPGRDFAEAAQKEVRRMTAEINTYINGEQTK